jgi:hypothetical protein
MGLVMLMDEVKSEMEYTKDGNNLTLYLDDITLKFTKASMPDKYKK